MPNKTGSFAEVSTVSILDGVVETLPDGDNTGDMHVYGEVALSSYEIGKSGPAGGLVFHLDDVLGTGGLEVALVNLGRARWGCFGTLVDGTDGIAIGTGQRNTDDI